MEKDQPIAVLDELNCLLDHIHTYLHDKARASDVQLLIISLRQLFEISDDLFRHILPGLHTTTIATMHEQLIRKRLWLQIHDLLRAIEKLSPLCRLLSEVTLSLIIALDELPTNPYANAPSPQSSPEAWQHTQRILAERIHSWRRGKRQSFSLLFAQQNALFPLPMMDKAFSLLLENLEILFQETLPTFSTLQSHDHEPALMLLLDQLQRTDQALIQSELLLEPLELLKKFYTS
ncbi:hypothetical protein [Tengunoibacter tsumagoiensis]|uniref:Uncharacterized protein n=1 Tax=Tengunoibacter tsumagoiensis TaxID=2014871 RepID=A0A402A447_9CHLR|nr:hypothetical protein [Tengunoibacter tsumagoiensis]GCE13900.1 hypothetical protein KTT_37590 [Tengunoibacter tsumagoiensis]